MRQVNKPSICIKYVGLKYEWNKIYEIFELEGLGKQIYKWNGEYYEPTGQRD